MKKIIVLTRSIFTAMLFIISIIACSSYNKSTYLSGRNYYESSKMKYWNIQRKGANGNGGEERLENRSEPGKWFEAAGNENFGYLRFTCWTHISEGRDFLMGDADNYNGLIKEDLDNYIEKLNLAHKQGVKVIVTMITLPGRRYIQDHGDFDFRLWTDKKYRKMAINFWKDLALVLRNHPAVYGYNILNEPCPERIDGFVSDNLEERKQEYLDWLKQNKGSLKDLNKFYSDIVSAIRKVDKETPIILDASFDAFPLGFMSLEPLNDANIIYSFHFYSPWQYTALENLKSGMYNYPKVMPESIYENAKGVKWTKENLAGYVQPVKEWAKKYNIPSFRIMAGEFGVHRQMPGAKEYLSDLIELFNSEGWHWSFWEYRSCGWGGFDYELGTLPHPDGFWKKREKEIPHEDLIERTDNPLWKVIKKELIK